MRPHRSHILLLAAAAAIACGDDDLSLPPLPGIAAAGAAGADSSPAGSAGAPMLPVAPEPPVMAAAGAPSMPMAAAGAGGTAGAAGAPSVGLAGAGGTAGAGGAPSAAAGAGGSAGRAGAPSAGAAGSVGAAGSGGRPGTIPGDGFVVVGAGGAPGRVPPGDGSSENWATGDFGRIATMPAAQRGLDAWASSMPEGCTLTAIADGWLMTTTACVTREYPSTVGVAINGPSGQAVLITDYYDVGGIAFIPPLEQFPRTGIKPGMTEVLDYYVDVVLTSPGSVGSPESVTVLAPYASPAERQLGKTVVFCGLVPLLQEMLPAYSQVLQRVSVASDNFAEIDNPAHGIHSLGSACFEIVGPIGSERGELRYVAVAYADGLVRFQDWEYIAVYYSLLRRSYDNGCVSGLCVLSRRSAVRVSQ